MTNKSYLPRNPDPIAACPFCGAEHASVLRVDAESWAVVCEVCGSAGPLAVEQENAVSHWNLRLATAPNHART